MKKGRPSKFNDALRETIIELYKENKTDEQVARIIGVSRRALQIWKRKYPDFLLSIRVAKAPADDLVEASLFSRAVGYSHIEEKIFQHEGQIIRAKTVRQYPPDTKAAEVWLRNRKPKEWSSKGDVEVTINNFPNMSDEQLLERAKEIAKKLSESNES